MTHFRISRERVVGRFKVPESPSVQGPQYFGEDLVVKDRVPISTERPSVIEPVTYGKHDIIFQACNDIPGSNRQEIPVPTDNGHPKGT